MFRGLQTLLRPSAFRFATQSAKDAPKALDKAKAKSEANRLTLYQNG